MKTYIYNIKKFEVAHIKFYTAAKINRINIEQDGIRYDQNWELIENECFEVANKKAYNSVKIAIPSFFGNFKKVLLIFGYKFNKSI